MPEDLSLRQQLANPGGAPTTAVRLGVAAFACLAFAGGFAVHSGRDAEPRSGAVVRVEQLAGEVRAAPKTAALELSDVASLPALHRPRRSRRAEAAPPATLVAAEATPTATPEPAATPTPVATAAPTPPPAPPTPAPPAPEPAPPAGDTFDSSG